MQKDFEEPFNQRCYSEISKRGKHLRPMGFSNEQQSVMDLEGILINNEAQNDEL